MAKPQANTDQAAILGAVIATFFALDGNAGAWTWSDAFVGVAAGLVLLGFAYLPDWPWDSVRSKAKALAIAAIGSFCLFLAFSPLFQFFTGPCAPDAKRCDDGDAVSARWLPWSVGLFFLALMLCFVIAEWRRSRAASAAPADKASPNPGEDDGKAVGTSLLSRAVGFLYVVVMLWSAVFKSRR